jgi:hypothetical protein
MSTLYLRESLKDIKNGFSECEILNKKAFIKHLSIFDQSEIETMQNEFYEDAKKRGLPTEEESLKILLDNEIWTNKDEAELLKIKSYLKNLKNTRSNKYLISEIKKLDEEIDKQQEIYRDLLYKKRELLGQTCEVYSENRSSEHYILTSFYKDEDCKIRFFSYEEIDQLERKDLVYIIGEYNEAYQKFKDINIQKIILADFFSMYMPFCDNVLNFFNKPIFELSVNQVKLLAYTKMFKNILENNSEIPNSIKNDPEKIIEFINAKEKGKKVTKNMEKSGASTIVGAQKEDYKNLGMESKNSLSEMLRKNNGKMDMNDLAKLME